MPAAAKLPAMIRRTAAVVLAFAGGVVAAGAVARDEPPLLVGVWSFLVVAALLTELYVAERT